VDRVHALMGGWSFQRTKINGEVGDGLETKLEIDMVVRRIDFDVCWDMMGIGEGQTPGNEL